MPLVPGRRGQTNTEYVVIVLLCAIGLITVVTCFGNDIKRLFFTSADSVRKGKNQDVVWAAGNFDKHNHTTGEMTIDSPYEWNSEAERWFDPATNKFVSFSAAGDYVEDPYMYKKKKK